MTTAEKLPIYHGGDLRSALRRADELGDGGAVIYSKAPKGASPEWGYWSVFEPMVRFWERDIYIYTVGAGSHARTIANEAKRLGA